MKEGESEKNEENQQPSEVEQKYKCNDLDSMTQDKEEEWWHMDFYGAMSKEGSGAGFWARSPKSDPKNINCILTAQIMWLNMKL